MAGQQPTARQMLAANLQNRQALLASAPRMRKLAGSIVQANPAGTELRQKLFNVGILTSIDVHVTASVTIGTAVAVPSARAPWNVLNYIKLRDFDATDRLNLTGYQAWLWQCVRQARMAHFAANYAGAAGSAPPSNGLIYTQPFTQTAVAAGTIQFVIRIPVAYDERGDLRGSVFMQTDAGEMFLLLGIAGVSASGSLTGADLDSVYITGAGSTSNLTSITVDIYQNYLNPLAVNGVVPLPAVDLATVYELAGQVRSSDNIAVGTEKLINFPNVRSILGMYLEYVNAGLFTAGTDISAIRTIANGNTTIQQWKPLDLADWIRMALGADLPGDNYYFSFRQRPIETAQYGNVQLGVTPSVVNGGNTYMEIMFESVYPKGSILSGLQQG